MNTTASVIGRPEPGEYAPYYEKYVVQVPGSDILATFDDQRRKLLLLLSGRSETDGDIRYSPGKWSVKEVVGHICDAERIFAYRALRISRGDATPMSSFDENEYTKNGPFARRALSDAIEDFIAVRRATLSLFRNLDEAAWVRRGIASNNEVTVRALAYIIAGHEQHHQTILKERYLK